MAPARRSHLEQAGIALLALLTAIENVVRDLADKTHSGRDSLEADKAKSNSAARAVPVPYESHAQCPPRRGWFVTRKWHMSEISRDYQTRVTGLPPFTEWIFENIEFDGFARRNAGCKKRRLGTTSFLMHELVNPKDSSNSSAHLALSTRRASKARLPATTHRHD